MHVTSGIPSSSQNIEKDSVRRMIPGDHLQAHYFYWLFDDMLAGHTRFLYNPYEFNLGDDDARFAPGTYNVPFSLIYAAGRAVAGAAFGWNLTGFITLWITILCAWLFLRRFVEDEILSAIFAIAAVSLPYRWVALLGGSPAGTAMMWIPVLVLGFDMAIRQGRLAGGILSAIAILGAFGIDSHVFFFGVLSAPAWCLLTFISAGRSAESQKALWIRRGIALIPLIITTVACAYLSHLAKQTIVSDENFAQGKGLDEVAIWTPFARNLIEWKGFGKASHIYVGFAMPALLLIGLLAAGLEFLRSPSDKMRRFAIMFLVSAGCVLAVVLALGPHGPFEGLVLKAVRKLIPPYSLVRQTVKIFTILPVLFALGGAVAVASISGALRLGRRGTVILALIAGGLVVGEHALQVRPTICLLDTRQAAYEAVANDAAGLNRKARAVVVPLWPGDSSWASLYEHYVSLYHIRMMNGYSPVVPESYKQAAFMQFGKINPGVLTDAGADDLISRGFGYIILHEDAFPEQVSPFPVWFTLQRFLNHPRLDFLAQGENTWAFKLRAEPRNPEAVRPEWNTAFPTKRWELESCISSNAVAKTDPESGGGGFLSLALPDAMVEVRPGNLPFSLFHWQARDGVIMIRARGTGRIGVELAYENERGPKRVLEVASTGWTWIDIPLGPYPADSYHVNTTLRLVEGTVDLDAALFRAGPWQEELPAGNAITIPAPLFFHAGYTDLSNGCVRFRPDCEPDDKIFYGPNLPFTPGQYEMRLEFESDAPSGTLLGELAMQCEGESLGSVSVVAGSPAVMNIGIARNLPVRLDFDYSRNGPIAIRNVVFKR